MPEIYIPFTQGQSEAVDAKLLPQGLFLQTQNVRYSKDARLGVRSAYRSAGLSVVPFAGASYDKSTDLYCFRPGTGNIAGTRIYTSPTASSTTAGAGTTHQEVPSGMVSAVQLLLAQQLPISTREIASIATLYSATSGVAYLAFTVIQTGTNVGVSPDPTSGGYILLAKVDPVSGTLIESTILFVAGTPHTNLKMVLCGGVVCLFYADVTDNVRMTSYVDNAGTGTLSIVTSNVIVVACFAAKGPFFDIANGASSTETYLVYQSAATTLAFGTVTSVGVYAALNTIAGTNGFLRPSITPTGAAPTDQIAIVWNDGASFITGNFKYTVYRRSTASFLIATTSYYTTGDCTGYPVVAGCNSTQDWAAAFNITGTGGTLRGCVVLAADGLTYVAKRNTLYGHHIASKPFAATNSLPVVTTTDVDLGTQAAGSFYIANCRQAQSGTGEPQVVAEWSQLSAMQSEAALTLKDPRQIVPVGLPSTSSPGSAGMLIALGGVTSKSKAWKMFRAEYGVLEDLASTCKLNGDLHFSGSRILTFDGSVITETGFSLPAQPVCVAGGGGALAAGTYQVLCVWEWFDAKGRRHRSAPSLPTTVVVGAAGTIAVTTDRPTATNKDCLFSAGNQVTLRIYRTTLAQPTIFLDAFNAKQSIGQSTASGGTITDSDATIATNEALYTQGVQGGLSGLLQNDRPPSAKYIWAGSDRLIIGGMENPSEVWFSKLRTEGEPMQWTNFAAYKAQVDGVVTAVCEMDGTWFIGTYNNWWRISGQGPQDNGADGSFDKPSRMPVNIGCISHKSMVLTGAGIIFQGATDRMYLLPRGGGDPQDIGLEVRDTLAAYPYVTASAFDQQSNVAYWAICDSAGTTGRLLVYDTRIKQWYVDNWINRVIRTLAVNNSLLRIDGQAIETTGNFQDTDAVTPTTVLPVLTMGDLRPFGMSGRGRLTRATILGEARDVSIAWSLTLEVSYDSGKTYTDVGTFTRANLATAIADSIEAEHMLLYPKGDTYRFRLSWTTPSATEGIVFNGLSFEAYPEAGLNRQAPARRA